MKNVIRKNSAAAFAVLLALTLTGAWLLGMFEGSEQSAEVSGAELASAVAGFILLVGGLAGILLLIRQSIRPWSDQEVLLWQRIRAEGRREFLKDATYKGLILGVLMVASLSMVDYWRTRSARLLFDSIWIYGALFLVCVLGIYYAAHLSWNANEKHYQNRIDSSEQP